MQTGWRYRLVSLVGAAIITSFTVFTANLRVSQDIFTTYVPLFSRLHPEILVGWELILAVGLATGIVIATSVPLFKPRSRRLLDTYFLGWKAVVIAMLALASLGYFNYSYRLPRTTIAMTGGALAVVLPVWFVWVRRRPHGDGDRAVLIGDDPDQIADMLDSTDLAYAGYLCPSRIEDRVGRSVLTDGGVGVRRLGGLSRIEDTLVSHDVDTVVLTFKEADRGEFFGALDACYEHGVKAKVHRRFADAVITDGESGEMLVDVAIEPWDFQDYVWKRLFDVGFATLGLVITAPITLAIAIAIKLEDGGSILYKQSRTAAFGDSLEVYKFRSMIENAEEDSGPTISDEDDDGTDARVTRVGSMIRPTHMDEIPQLWNILMGEMSVVGPRPERPELETEFDTMEIDWHKRWFIKPGLTGLAQINDVTGKQPEEKLRYDLEYIRSQSLVCDVQILLRQMYKVVDDAGSFLR